MIKTHQQTLMWHTLSIWKFQTDAKCISKVWQSDCDKNLIKSLEKGHVKCHMISSSKIEPAVWPVSPKVPESIRPWDITGT